MQEQQKVWGAISTSWYKLRRKPFPDVEKYLDDLSKYPAGKILEVGCGNCRNLFLFAKNGFNCYGVDFSKEMLEYAKQFCELNNIKVDLSFGLAEKLHFKDNYFDYALFIAVLHNLNNKYQRKDALSEIKRVMKRKGLVLITVWNKWQPRFILKDSEQYIEWKVNKKSYYRYYYLYNYFELRSLLEEVGFKVVKSSGLFGKNLIFLVEK